MVGSYYTVLCTVIVVCVAWLPSSSSLFAVVSSCGWLVGCLLSGWLVCLAVVELFSCCCRRCYCSLLVWWAVAS